jgi:hypothetical protein
VPRLSIIIPHLGNDQSLENTILSVLENRPASCEIIVVHGGSYRDPYELGDELMLLEELGSTPVKLLNSALVAACAPVVCVLTPGVQLRNECWAESAVTAVAGGLPLAAIGVAVNQQTTHYGISTLIAKDSAALQNGQLDQLKKTNPLAPSLICGFYDRKTLLAVDGWATQLRFDNADVELALLFGRLGAACAVVDDIVDCQSVRPSDNQRIKQLAELSVAYGLSSKGATSAMTDLLRGCLTGNISGSVAWASGIIGAVGPKQFQSRFESAEQRFGQLELQRQNSSNQWRRAAA